MDEEWVLLWCLRIAKMLFKDMGSKRIKEIKSGIIFSKTQN